MVQVLYPVWWCWQFMSTTRNRTWQRINTIDRRRSFTHTPEKMRLQLNCRWVIRFLWDPLWLTRCLFLGMPWYYNPISRGQGKVLYCVDLDMLDEPCGGRIPDHSKVPTCYQRPSYSCAMTSGKITQSILNYLEKRRRSWCIDSLPVSIIVLWYGKRRIFA